MARLNPKNASSAQENSERSSFEAEYFNDLPIHYLVCSHFIAKRKGSQICQCHQSHNSLTNAPHTPSSNDQTWNPQAHTEQKTENFHGYFDREKFIKKPYVRVSPKIDLATIRTLLFDKWKFPNPKLIMSIIGGSSAFTLDDRLKTNFVNGIANIAVRSDIWMITNGYNNGLVQLVGQAVHRTKIKRSDDRAFALAICKWGGIKDVHKLLPKKKDEENKRFDVSDDEEEPNEARKRKQYELNKDQTHYLMLDDGQYRTVETKQYRTNLYKQIAQTDVHIPAVTIVMNGGDATISNIYHDLRENISVVIIEGTGRVADFFSRWLIYTREMDLSSKKQRVYDIEELKNQTPVQAFKDSKTSKKSNQPTEVKISPFEITLDLHINKLTDLFSKYKTQLKQDLENLLGCHDNSNAEKHSTTNEKQTRSNDEITRIRDEVMYCLQPAVRSNITVFNLNSEKDLSYTIFQSIGQSYKKRLEDKNRGEMVGKNPNANTKISLDSLFELTMDWDCVDVAKEFVLENSLKTIEKEKLNEHFVNALKRNLFTFVHEFLRLGFKPEKIFFPEQAFTDTRSNTLRYKVLIDKLYNNEIMGESTHHLAYFMQVSTSFSTRNITTTDGLNVVLRALIGDYMHILYFDNFKEEDKARTNSGLTIKRAPKELDKPRELESMASLTEKEKEQLAHDYIMRDLFLWSILTNRVDMAKVFLSYMKYRICPALIATKIFKKYYQPAAYGKLKDSYNESAQYFEQYAVDCLDKADDHDAAKACEIVLQRNELYGYVNCLQVAADAKDRSFVAAPACTEAMNNIWYDKLHPNQMRKRDKLGIFLGFITFGIVAPVTVSFRENEQGTIGESPKRSLRSCGINYCDPFALEYPRISRSNLGINQFFHRLKNFHQSLLMKFCYHFIIYLFFLLLFSYVLLFQFKPPKSEIPSIDWTEILTIILVSCMLIEEIHYFFAQDSLLLFGKLKSYFRDPFKPLILSAIVLFYIGLIVRFTDANSENDFTAARIIMAIDIELWWLSALSFIIVFEFLGPQLVAIAEMFKDLAFFVCIIAVVMIGYGVASRSMVYYPLINGFGSTEENPINPSFDGRSVFRQVIAPVYFFLHGEFGNELDNLDTNRDAGWSIATHIIFAFHMLFVNILLTNLLIAMFSKRFERVYEETRNIWHSQQYLFTRKYYSRAPLFPPISLFFDIYYLGRMFFFFLQRKISNKSADRKAKVFRMIPKDRKRIKEWCEFEDASTYEYAQNEVRAAKAAFAKASMGQNPSSIENKEDLIHSQDDTGDVAKSLKQLQDNARGLNASMETMKDRFDKLMGTKNRK